MGEGLVLKILDLSRLLNTTFRGFRDFEGIIRYTAETEQTRQIKVTDKEMSQSLVIQDFKMVQVFTSYVILLTGSLYLRLTIKLNSIIYNGS